MTDSGKHPRLVNRFNDGSKMLWSTNASYFLLAILKHSQEVYFVKMMSTFKKWKIINLYLKSGFES